MGALADLDREQIRRRGFAEFVRRAWPQIESSEIVWAPHLDLMCAHYEAAFRGEIRNLVVNVPPGTSKSTVSSILYPAWVWTLDPAHRFIYASYGEDISTSFARRQFSLVMGDWYRERWPHVEIERGNRANVNDFWTTAKGRRFSTMFGGQATGVHCHTLFVDDPHKPDDLSGSPDSVKLEVDEAWRRWTETFSTRVADAKRFVRVCIMQRLHEDDIAGRMLREPGTVGLVLPMRFEPDRACDTPWGKDWRTEEGELLCPARFPAAFVDGRERIMTTMAFAAQHQQRPTPASGSLFMKESFERRWATLPQGARYTMSVDTSLKAGRTSDYTVIQVWASDKWRTHYLVDQVRERIGFTDQVAAVRAMRAKWPQTSTILIEAKSNGDAIIDTLRRSVGGVVPVHPQGGKFSRAEAVEPTVRSDCWFPQARWMEAFINECATFPVGSNDDQVDCMTQYLVWASAQTRSAVLRQAMANARTRYGM